MKYFTHTSASILAATVLAVAGCGGGGGGGSYGDGGTGATPSPPVATPPPSSPPPTGSDFTAFMRDLLVPAKTTDIDEPAELESIEWVFADDENEAAYDDIITASES